MVMILRKRRTPHHQLKQQQPSSPQNSDSDSEFETRSKPSEKKRRRAPSSDDSESEFDDSEDNDGYERIREQRIRENKERMEKLGIFSLSKNVFSNKGNGNVRRKNPTIKRKRYPPLYPQSRKSERLKNVPKSQYIETEGSLRDMGITMPDEWKPEVYTEEHEKLLGDCKEKWELKTDGFEEDGERAYNLAGIPCHQCRQKIMGKLTFCGKCRCPHGQFCGDCLYTRYGENVLEANSNPDWLCPVCRDICNCSRCRRTKGWQPINIPYSKIVSSRFKSVAHYLILTRRAGVSPQELENELVSVDLSTDESTKPQQNEESDYSAQTSESDSDSDSDDENSKGGKKKDNSGKQFNEDTNEVGLATNEAVLEDSSVPIVQPLVSCK